MKLKNVRVKLTEDMIEHEMLFNRQGKTKF